MGILVPDLQWFLGNPHISRSRKYRKIAFGLVIFPANRKQNLVKMCAWEPESTKGVDERELWKAVLRTSARLNDGQRYSSNPCVVLFLFSCRITRMRSGFLGWSLRNKWVSLSFQIRVWTPYYMASCTTLKALTALVGIAAHSLKPINQSTADWKAQRCWILQAISLFSVFFFGQCLTLCQLCDDRCETTLHLLHQLMSNAPKTTQEISLIWQQIILECFCIFFTFFSKTKTCLCFGKCELYTNICEAMFLPGLIGREKV